MSYSYNYEIGKIQQKADDLAEIELRLDEAFKALGKKSYKDLNIYKFFLLDQIRLSMTKDLICMICQFKKQNGFRPRVHGEPVCNFPMMRREDGTNFKFYDRKEIVSFIKDREPKKFNRLAIIEEPTE